MRYLVRIGHGFKSGLMREIVRVDTEYTICKSRVDPGRTVIFPSEEIISNKYIVVHI